MGGYVTPSFPYTRLCSNNHGVRDRFRSNSVILNQDPQLVRCGPMARNLAALVIGN